MFCCHQDVASVFGDSQCKCPQGFKGDGNKSCEGEKRTFHDQLVMLFGYLGILYFCLNWKFNWSYNYLSPEYHVHEPHTMGRIFLCHDWWYPLKFSVGFGQYVICISRMKSETCNTNFIWDMTVRFWCVWELLPPTISCQYCC